MAGRVPDLVCVGAQKAATTWLYDVLRGHPRVFLSAVKEVHYFSQLYNGDAARYGPKHRAEQARQILKYLSSRTVLSAAEAKRWKQAEHLLASEVDDEWYREIFADALEDQVCVEICPSYMNMPDIAVTHVHRLNPSAEILVLVRDPVERCWSQIRMHVARKMQSPDFERLVSGTDSLWPYEFYSDYSASVPRWEALYGQKVNLVLHDSIANDPADALRKILGSFDALHPLPPLNLGRTVFKGEDHDLPPRLRRKLIDLLGRQYDFLRDRFPDEVSQWLLKHEKLASQAVC